MKILKHDVYDASVDWAEDHHQLAITQLLRRIEKTGQLTFAADMNAGKRSRGRGSKLKALGMRAGEPDLRVYVDGGKLISFEVKKLRGATSQEQKDRMATLTQLGFACHVIRERTPGQARDRVMEILIGHGLKELSLEAV